MYICLNRWLSEIVLIAFQTYSLDDAVQKSFFLFDNFINSFDKISAGFLSVRGLNMNWVWVDQCVKLKNSFWKFDFSFTTAVPLIWTLNVCQRNLRTTPLNNCDCYNKRLVAANSGDLRQTSSALMQSAEAE